MPLHRQGMKTVWLKPRASFSSSFKTLARLDKRVYMFVGLVLLSVVAMASVRARRYPRDHCEIEEHTLARSQYKVPDIVHFQRMGNDSLNISVSDAACVRAALRHQGQVWIHTDNPSQMRSALLQHSLRDRVILKNMFEDTSSRRIPPENILWTSGGIYLKNDVYLLRNVDIMRTEEYSATPGGDIVATAKGVSTLNTRCRTAPDVVLDKDWGALYIFDVLKNCSVKAVRLGTRNAI